MSSCPKTRAAWAAAFVVGLALPLFAAILEARHELAPDGIGVDDAYIALRFARNLAHGDGWV